MMEMTIAHTDRLKRSRFNPPCCVPRERLTKSHTNPTPAIIIFVFAPGRKENSKGKKYMLVNTVTKSMAMYLIITSDS